MTIADLTAPAFEGHAMEALSGTAGVVARAVEGLCALYLGQPPNPEELAYWLIDVQVAAPRLRPSIVEFAELLGEEGLSLNPWIG